MRKIAITVLIFTLVGGSGISTFSGARLAAASVRKAPTRSAEVIVKLKMASGALTEEGRLITVNRTAEGVAVSVGAHSSEPLIRQAGPALKAQIAEIISRRGLDRVYVMKIDPSADIDAVIAELNRNESVEYAEPNYLVKPGTDIPSDPRFRFQWGLRNLGLAVDGYGATLDADIKALDAWDITTGIRDIIVAVTDTGVDITHPDLAENIFKNPGEVAGNGRDDDGNGYVDDVNGYNVAGQNGDVSDVLGHGTQMAGIISAVMSNGVGISGISRARILPVKFFRKTGPDPTDVEGTVADAARAIVYAVSAGATIINASWETFLDSNQVPAESIRSLSDAVHAAEDADILMVCIAGNEGLDNDTVKLYPGHYQLSNQIVVAASDYNDEIWHPPFNLSVIKSGYGLRTVQLFAPGVSVDTIMARGNCPLCSASADPNEWYALISGTSASAAFTSGVAALIKSAYPEATPPVIKRRLIESVDVRDQLKPFVSSGGRLNALGALTIQLTVAPPILNKVKLKGGGKLQLVGDAFQRGAVVLVGEERFLTRPKNGDLSVLVANVPEDLFPSGGAVSVTVRNPDGGASQPKMFTR